MKDQNFKYILRFTIEPGFHEEERLDKLAHFCGQAGIDNVSVFINAEELNNGHLTVEDTKKWMDMVLRSKAKLAQLGITLSINPWATLFQIDRGRTLKEGQDFNLMVDPFGRKASAHVCPICPKWRSYIKEIFSLYASVHPEVIWVDDDMRLQNHAPLQWGGCFCEKHMALFSHRVGRKLTREEFHAAIVQPGNPHPYREIWLEAARKDIVDVCRIIGTAVHEISPDTHVGLMSDEATIFCAEDRDWTAMLDALACKGTRVSRPHLGSYCETSPQACLWNFSTATRFSRAVLPRKTEIYPELENFSYSRFFKSRTFTKFQLDTSLMLDINGMTFNIFDMMGNGVLIREGYHEELAQTKQFANSVLGLQPKLEDLRGVKVLCSEHSSHTIHTSTGKSLYELIPKELFWAGLLSSYGIPNCIDLDGNQQDRIVAVSGQYLRNLCAEELESLFEHNFVLLEGEAANTLFEMGFGQLAGIENALWREMDSGYQVYEQVCDGKEYYGVNEARMTSQFLAGDYLDIEYSGHACSITDVRNPEGKRVGVGIAVYENRVLILPYGHFKWWLQTHLNPIRQAIVQDVLKNIGHEECSVFVRGDPNIMAHLYDKGDHYLLLLANFSGDNHPSIRLYAPKLDAQSIEEVNRHNAVSVKATVRREGEDVIILSALENMELKAFIWRKGT